MSGGMVPIGPGSDYALIQAMLDLDWCEHGRRITVTCIHCAEAESANTIPAPGVSDVPMNSGPSFDPWVWKGMVL